MTELLDWHGVTRSLVSITLQLLQNAKRRAYIYGQMRLQTQGIHDMITQNTFLYLLFNPTESAWVSRRCCRLPSGVCDKATADKDFCCSLWVEMRPMVLRKTDFHDELIKQDPAGAFLTAFQTQNTIPKTRKHVEDSSTTLRPLVRLVWNHAVAIC